MSECNAAGTNGWTRWACARPAVAKAGHVQPEPMREIRVLRGPVMATFGRLNEATAVHAKIEVAHLGRLQNCSGRRQAAGGRRQAAGEGTACALPESGKLVQHRA